MKTLYRIAALLLITFKSFSNETIETLDFIDSLKVNLEKLVPIHKELGTPQPGDWLLSHKEDGQSFQEYLDINPITAHGKRNVIYIQPIGDFSKTQMEAVKLVAEYLKCFYELNVVINDGKPLNIIPKTATRKNPMMGQQQILSTYVLDRVLKTNMPKDAAMHLALTSTDLWPGKNWNFVFGQASFRHRVGVWSMYRNGYPDKSKADYQLFLNRTIKTAVHEAGHMFSIKHCIAYECVMNGSNNRAESDRRPLYLCPECCAKVCYATKNNPIERYKKLKAICDKIEFKSEAQFFQTSIKQLKP